MRVMFEIIHSGPNVSEMSFSRLVYLNAHTVGNWMFSVGNLLGPVVAVHDNSEILPGLTYIGCFRRALCAWKETISSCLGW